MPIINGGAWWTKGDEPARIWLHGTPNYGTDMQEPDDDDPTDNDTGHAEQI